MKIIRPRKGGYRALRKAEFLSGVAGQELDTSGDQFEKMIKGKSPDGKFLRSLLSPPKKPTDRISRRFAK